MVNTAFELDPQNIKYLNTWHLSALSLGGNTIPVFSMKSFLSVNKKSWNVKVTHKRRTWGVTTAIKWKLQWIQGLNMIHIFPSKIWKDRQNKFVMSSPGRSFQDSLFPLHSPNFQAVNTSYLLLASGTLVGDRTPVTQVHHNMHGRTFIIL